MPVPNVNERGLSSKNCDWWQLDNNVVANEPTCDPDPSTGRSAYLMFEFWRLQHGEVIDDRDLQRVYFVVSRGMQPNVTVNGDESYSPPSPAFDDFTSGAPGSLYDQAAKKYYRAYHRVFVPVNANSSSTDQVSWFVTVANLEETGTGTNRLYRYSIRVSCTSEEAAPCPQPLPAAGPCADHGTCAPWPGTNMPRVGLSKVCKCDSSHGDHGCNEDVPTLNNSQPLNVQVDFGAWKYFQIDVGQQADSQRQALLVEMTRNAGQGFGGDPLLMFMPKDATGRVPYVGDMLKRSDRIAFIMMQDYHYRMERDFSSSTTFYVAIYNNNQRLAQKDLSKGNFTLLARWRGGKLCPQDCSGRGTCYSSWEIPNALNVPRLSDPQALDSVPPYLCDCNPGFGGLFCEGTLKNLTVTAGPMDDRTNPNALAPGAWAFYFLDLTDFNYKKNDVKISWQVVSLNGEPGRNFTNGYFTLNEQSFPRGSDLTNTGDPYRFGYRIPYPRLCEKGDPASPMVADGRDLQPGYTYVVGVYNNQYFKQQPLQYTLTVSVPPASKTWLHPYMSVVLGVTASVILCLFMTLFRRIAIRRGWGPFRQRQVLLQQETAMMQIAPQPRDRGVPASIIATFPVQEYRATKAEKAKLNQHRRDAVDQAVTPAAATAAAAPASSRRPSSAGIGSHRLANAGGSAALPNGPTAAAAPAAETAAGAAAAAAASAAVPSAPPQGVPPTVVEDDDEPMCTVCLGEYEEGEAIMQLPCHHQFHDNCISKWMLTHNTCPICRIMLVPPREPAPELQPQGQQQQQYGSVAIPMGSEAGAAAAVAAGGGQRRGILGQWPWRRSSAGGGGRGAVADAAAGPSGTSSSSPGAALPGAGLPRVAAPQQAEMAVVDGAATPGTPGSSQLVVQGPSATLGNPFAVQPGPATATSQAGSHSNDSPRWMSGSPRASAPALAPLATEASVGSSTRPAAHPGLPPLLPRRSMQDVDDQAASAAQGPYV